MFIVNITAQDDKRLKELNYKICESLAGWKPFRDNEVFVSVVDPTDDTETKFSFEVIVGSDEDTSKMFCLNLELESDGSVTMTEDGCYL